MVYEAVETMTPAHEAVEHGNLPELTRLLDRGVDPNEVWSNMTLLLHAIDTESDGAAQTGEPLDAACTAVLLAYGADPEHPGPNGEVPRLFAFHAGHGLAVRLLETHIAKNRGGSLPDLCPAGITNGLPSTCGRSVRAGGDTKTKKSRWTLALPRRCVVALRGHYDAAPEEARQGSAVVFTRGDGASLDRHTALRAFRKVVRPAGLLPGEWAPRELRHSFVSLLSDDGMPLENIARLVGHVDTTTTETVYRKQIRPVVLDGATAMDRIFPADKDS